MNPIRGFFPRAILTVGGGWAVCDYLAGFHMVILIYDWLLVVTVALVASLKFGQMGTHRGCRRCPLRIMISLEAERSTTPAFLATTHTPESTAALASIPVPTAGGFCGQKGHCLTLHVGTHQGAVGIIVLQEWNHGRSNGEYHLRRNVHQVNGLFWNSDVSVRKRPDTLLCMKWPSSSRASFACATTKLSSSSAVRVHHLIRYPLAGRIRGLIHHAVGSLDETVLVLPLHRLPES